MKTVALILAAASVVCARGGSDRPARMARPDKAARMAPRSTRDAASKEDRVASKEEHAATKEAHGLAKDAFEEACSEELVACGWTGPREEPEEEDDDDEETPVLAVKSMRGERGERAKDGEMKAVKECMLGGVDLGTTSEVCLVAMSDLEGLSKPGKHGKHGKGDRGKGDGRGKDHWAGLTEEEIAAKKEAMAAIKVELAALKEVVVGLKADLQTACAVEFAECGADVGYDLTAEEKAALSYEDKVVMKEAAKEHRECMANVFDAASEGCVSAKNELDTALDAAKEGYFGKGRGKGKEGKRGEGGKEGKRGAKEVLKEAEAAAKAVTAAYKTAAKAATKMEAKALKAASEVVKRAGKGNKGGGRN